MQTRITYLEKSPRYRADNGFQPSNNIRSIRSYGTYNFRFDEGLLEKLSPSYMIGHQWNFAQEAKDKFIEFALAGNLRLAQTNFHAFYRRQAEKYGGEDFDNIWMIHNCFQSRPNELLAFGGAINYGNEIARSDDPIMGRETSAFFWIDIKPLDRLLIENNYNYVKSNNLDTDERLYEGYILRSRWNFQISKELTFRLIGQYNDFSESYDLDPLLTYRLNPFSIFYIGSTFDYTEYNTYNDNNQSDITGTSARLASRQFFMKLQYLFQL